MENDDGESGDPAASARMWHARRVSSPRKRHLLTVVVRSAPAFFQPANPARRTETVRVSFWTLVLHKRVFLASVTRAQSSRHPLQASRDTNV